MTHSMSPAEQFVVHGAAVAAAGIGGGLAHLPGADAPVLVSIQSAMVLALADINGVRLSRAAAAELVLTMSATMAGRNTAAFLLRLVPGLGELACAVTAAAFTEAVGLAAIRWFQTAGPGVRSC